MPSNLWLKAIFKRYKMGKAEIRRGIKLQTKTLSLQQSQEQGRSVIEQLEQIVAQRKPQVVALFAPLPDEIPIGELAQRLKCRVVIPRVDGDDMEFYDYDMAAMTEGSFGILEPQDTRLCHAAEIDLMVVPGVAFTSSGNRLGRGKGFYDKYLSREGFRAYCVGVCYAHQLLEQLPTEPHDKPMDMVVSGNNE